MCGPSAAFWNSCDKTERGRCLWQRPLVLPSVVTLRTLRNGTLLTAAQKTPLAQGQTAFLSARFAVCLLPGAQRFSLLQVEESVFAQVLSNVAQQSHRKSWLSVGALNDFTCSAEVNSACAKVLGKPKTLVRRKAPPHL